MLYCFGPKAQFRDPPGRLRSTPHRRRIEQPRLPRAAGWAQQRLFFCVFSVCCSRPPVFYRLGRVVSLWLRRLLFWADHFRSGRGFDNDPYETNIACAPSLHAPRAGTWLTVYRAPQMLGGFSENIFTKIKISRDPVDRFWRETVRFKINVYSFRF